ncbi:zinc transporter 7 [Eucalyptus grandis]|uniref:zinc transporter 7 n=1 Tax=Eucalyptus grandis TaxID=71139 RepID=UPI00192E7DD2|nr:zinc transporter 7 [Eucalyptus grandis]XP_010053113.2 zinc transporter 7 [Eucalyptus grandis]
MASVQCFRDAEETYYQQSNHGHHMDLAMNHSHTQCYGQSEKHHPSGHGYLAQGHGHNSGYLAQGHGHNSGYLAQGHGHNSGFLAQGHGHNSGYLAHGHGHNSGHAMAKPHTPCMGQNNGRFLGQHAQTHCITQGHGPEHSSFHGKSKMKGEYEKKEKILIRRKSKGYRSGDDSCSSESESDDDHC